MARPTGRHQASRPAVATRQGRGRSRVASRRSSRPGPTGRAPLDRGAAARALRPAPPVRRRAGHPTVGRLAALDPRPRLHVRGRRGHPGHRHRHFPGTRPLHAGDVRLPDPPARRRPGQPPMGRAAPDRTDDDRSDGIVGADRFRPLGVLDHRGPSGDTAGAGRSHRTGRAAMESGRPRRRPPRRRRRRGASGRGVHRRSLQPSPQGPDPAQPHRPHHPIGRAGGPSGPGPALLHRGVGHRLLRGRPR